MRKRFIVISVLFMGTLICLFAAIVGYTSDVSSDQGQESDKPIAKQEHVVSEHETELKNRDKYRAAQFIRFLAQVEVDTTGIDPEEDGATGPALPWRAGDPLDPVVIGTMKKAVDDGIPSPTMEEFIASEEALAERVAVMESAR